MQEDDQNLPSDRLERFFVDAATAEERKLRVALTRATMKRYRFSVTQAVGLVQDLQIEIQPVPVEEGDPVIVSRQGLDLSDTSIMTSKESEASFLGFVVDLTWSFLEVHPEIDTIRVIFDGTLLDRRGWEHLTSILSVEATREVADSLNWENLDDLQILEHFDLRYAGGRPILAHGDPDESAPGEAADLTELAPKKFEPEPVDSDRQSRRAKRIEHTHMHGHPHHRTGRIHEPGEQAPHEHGHKRQYGRYSNLTGTGGAYGSYRMFHEHPHSHPSSRVAIEERAVRTQLGQAGCLSLLVVLPLFLLAHFTWGAVLS